MPIVRILLLAVGILTTSTVGLSKSESFVGCIFNPSLCKDRIEFCFDDDLFGRCVPKHGRVNPDDLYRYELDQKEVVKIQRELDRLLKLGFKWSHPYTQCSLQSYLKTLRNGGKYDWKTCENLINHDGGVDDDASKASNADDESTGQVRDLIASSTSHILSPNNDNDDVSKPRIGENDVYGVARLSGDEQENDVGHFIDQEAGWNDQGSDDLEFLKNTILMQRLKELSDGLELIRGENSKSNYPQDEVMTEEEFASLLADAYKDTILDLAAERVVFEEEAENSRSGGDQNSQLNRKPLHAFRGVYNSPNSFRKGQTVSDIIVQDDFEDEGRPEGDGEADDRFPAIKRKSPFRVSASADGDERERAGISEQLSEMSTEDLFKLGALLESLAVKDGELIADGESIPETYLTAIDLQKFRDIDSVIKDDQSPRPDPIKAGIIDDLLFLNPNNLKNDVSNDLPREPSEEINDDKLQRFDEREIGIPKNPGLVKMSRPLFTEAGPLFYPAPAPHPARAPVIYLTNGGAGQNGKLDFLEKEEDEGEGDPVVREGLGSFGGKFLEGADDEWLFGGPSSDAILQRSERLDVKKPGPHFQINNYAFNNPNSGSIENDLVKSTDYFDDYFGGEKGGRWRQIKPIITAVDEDDGSSIQKEIELESNLVDGVPNGSDEKGGITENVGQKEFLEHARLTEKPQSAIEESNAHQQMKTGLGGVGQGSSADPSSSTMRRQKVKVSDGIGATGAGAANTKIVFPSGQMSNQAEHVDDDHRTTNEEHRYDVVDSSYAYVVTKHPFKTWNEGAEVVKLIADLLHLRRYSFSNIRVEANHVTFKVFPSIPQRVNASEVAKRIDDIKESIQKETGIEIVETGIGDRNQVSTYLYPDTDKHLFILTLVLCAAFAAFILTAVVLYVIRRHGKSKEKLQRLAQPDTEASKDYQDLCRARMATKAQEKPEAGVHASSQRITSLSRDSEGSNQSPSSRSSTSSWSEEPAISNMDISTGHMVLSYMEDHLKNKDRLEQEWASLCAYEAEPCSTAVATKAENLEKNRSEDALPYDHSRIILNDLTNSSGSDYINASTITDHDPRNPSYIVTQGPLANTAGDFWQMIWEQGSVVIVMLTRLTENNQEMCHRYWPEEGSQLYHIYEVHLVSEHIWCDDYLVRSFYLKNLKTSETRTVTQFHFLSWPENVTPLSTKALLEFRRKVNKSYRGRSCPIVVHCSDGIGRTGTYCSIDMVLNRISKGAKEIDIAATLEHIRDQRQGMVKTRQQFEFVLMAVAEEVHAILKALPH